MQRASAAVAAASTSAVLDDDDLLDEILLRLVFLTSLVRAALVCKRWLRLASAPAFLRHFRDLHPPSLLGFYVTTRKKTPRFVPLPQPPELASVVRRANFDLDNISSDRLDVDYFCNGLLLLTTLLWNHSGHAGYKRSMHCPLYPTRHVTCLPPLPQTSIHDGFTCYSYTILPKGCGDGLSYFCLAMWCKGQQSVLVVYVLQEGIWATYSSVAPEIPIFRLLLHTSLIVDDRIYNLARVSDTYKLVSLGISSSCLSLVNLPEDVELLRTELSLENDSEVHLIHLKGSQLRIWRLYMVENDDGLANWLLVNTVCLDEICANHMIPTNCLFEDVGDPGLMVYAVGFNSGLFFLEMNGVLYLLDTKCKTANKVFEVTREDRYLLSVTPFMMVWPPKFPAMKEG